MFEGNLIERLNDIEDEYACQLACKYVAGCKYYIYDTSDKDCQMLDSSRRQCDLIKVVAGDGGQPYDEKCLPKQKYLPTLVLCEEVTPVPPQSTPIYKYLIL